MNKYYCNTKKDGVLYRYCKNEGLDYLYMLNERRKAERMDGFYAKVFRRLIMSLRSRFGLDGLYRKT